MRFRYPVPLPAPLSGPAGTVSFLRLCQIGAPPRGKAKSPERPLDTRIPPDPMRLFCHPDGPASHGRNPGVVRKTTPGRRRFSPLSIRPKPRPLYKRVCLAPVFRNIPAKRFHAALPQSAFPFGNFMNVSRVSQVDTLFPELRPTIHGAGCPRGHV